jgi:PelA/Pel-15E family pectate lyase
MIDLLRCLSLPFRLGFAISCVCGATALASAAPTLERADEKNSPAIPWGADAFVPLSPARIAALPEQERSAWQAYWQASQQHTRSLPARDLTDYSPTKPLPGAPIGASYSHGVRLDSPAAWYASAEAQTIADRVVAWQTPVGGWTKSGDYTRMPTAADNHGDVWSAGTFDNDATILELRYLALVISHEGSTVPEARSREWREAFARGVAYTLAAQYPNGGFPQIYPLVGGYHDAITYNDDAMVHILEFFRDLAAAHAPYTFVSPEQRASARAAGQRGLACLLATQMKSPEGKLTVWGQQHDALTLQPCAARNFEPISACSSESTGIVEFLMTVPQPSREIVAAVDSAVDWLTRHALHGVSWDRDATEGTGLVPNPNAPDLWARFYTISTGQPIFGERDRTIHFRVTELSLERRKGYQWYTPRPAATIARHASWRKNVGAP